MRTEEKFVGLEKSHVVSGKKHLLYSEMEVLTALQKYNQYKKFRKEELAMKTLLKKVVMEINKEMEVLTEYMPEIKTEIQRTTIATKESNTKRDSLEEEIQKIRQKISMLGMN